MNVWGIMRILVLFGVLITSIIYFASMAYSQTHYNGCVLFKNKSKGPCGYVIAEGVILFISSLSWLALLFLKREQNGMIFPTIDLIMAGLLTLLTLVAAIIQSAGLGDTCNSNQSCVSSLKAPNTAQGAVWVAFIFMLATTGLFFMARRSALSSEREENIRKSVPGLDPNAGAAPAVGASASK